MPYLSASLAKLKSNAQLERKAQRRKGPYLQTSQIKRNLRPFFAFILFCLALPIAFVF